MLKMKQSLRLLSIGKRTISEFKTFSGGLMYQGLQPWDGKRYFTNSSKRESALIVGGVSILAAAVAAQYAHSLYVAMGNKKASEQKEEGASTNSESTTDSATEARTEARAEGKSDSKTESSADESTDSNPKATSWFARNFYEGGFEEKMTKREAALILGIRESASPDRVKDAHRRILLLNHPDRGGSAFIAAKINEAKDILMKGK